MKAPPAQAMGIVDAIEIGEKKLTIQTEFFPRPKPRAETKIYLGGALKKVYTQDLSGTPADGVQRALGEIHQQKMKEIIEGLKQKAEEK